MRRLRDIESTSPLMDKAQAMIDATPPLPESREQMLRVRRELDRPRGLAASLRRLPALALAGLVVMFGTSAFAAVRYWVAHTETAAVERPSAHPAAKRKVPSAVPMPLPTPVPLPVPVPMPESADKLQPVPAPATDRPAPKRVTRSAIALRARRPARAASRAESHAPAKSGAPSTIAVREPDKVSTPAVSPQPAPQALARAEQQRATEAPVVTDNERVHRAVRALRREGNPALAARLLDRVSRDAPGPLAEEALSLRIEAALAQGDPRTAAFAREYIARYPKGRYLRVARRALQAVE